MAEEQELKMLLQMTIWEFTEDTGAQPWLELGDKQGLSTETSPPHVALGSQKGFQALEENLKKKNNSFISREEGLLLFSVGGIFISLHEGISKHR